VNKELQRTPHLLPEVWHKGTSLLYIFKLEWRHPLDIQSCTKIGQTCRSLYERICETRKNLLSVKSWNGTVNCSHIYINVNAVPPEGFRRTRIPSYHDDIIFFSSQLVNVMAIINLKPYFPLVSFIDFVPQVYNSVLSSTTCPHTPHLHGLISISSNIL
jgi:hypothetical protein